MVIGSSFAAKLDPDNKKDRSEAFSVQILAKI